MAALSGPFIDSPKIGDITYGSQFLDQIIQKRNVILQNTIVRKSVKTNGAITATFATVMEKIISKKSVHMSSSNCQGLIQSQENITMRESSADKLDASKNITLFETNITTAATCNGDFKSENCKKLGNIEGLGMVTVINCESVVSIKGKEVHIEDAKVYGSITSKEALIKNSEICGTLFYNALLANFENSKINKVIVGFPNKADEKSKDYDAKEKQILKLSKCHIKELTFENENGEVCLYEGSTIDSLIGGIITSV